MESASPRIPSQSSVMPPNPNLDPRTSDTSKRRLHLNPNLNLDILELVFHFNRTDPHTLASTALAFASCPCLLHATRKLLYSSVSLDYADDVYGYGYEKQTRLRRSLARHPHLCAYIRNLRVGLPPVALDAGLRAVEDDEDEMLCHILQAVRNVENLHVIGNSNWDPRTHLRYRSSHSISSTQRQNRPGGKRVGCDAPDKATMEMRIDEALKHLFALPSLRNVILQNIHPLTATYLSHFTNLRHLELISVGSVVPAPSLGIGTQDHWGGDDTGMIEGESGSGTGDSLDIDGSSAEWRAKGALRRDGSRTSGEVHLENFVLNVHTFKPIWDSISTLSSPSNRTSQYRDHETLTNRSPFTPLSFTHLKQLSICVWDPSDAKSIWTLLSLASHSLEKLTLRYFHCTSCSSVFLMGTRTHEWWW